jgi:hypothetical protein
MRRQVVLAGGTLNLIWTCDFWSVAFQKTKDQEVQ